jgi:hypothetical protein
MEMKLTTKSLEGPNMIYPPSLFDLIVSFIRAAMLFYSLFSLAMCVTDIFLRFAFFCYCTLVFGPGSGFFDSVYHLAHILIHSCRDLGVYRSLSHGIYSCAVIFLHPQLVLQNHSFLLSICITNLLVFSLSMLCLGMDCYVCWKMPRPIALA